MENAPVYYLRRRSNGAPFKWSTRARGLPSLSKAEGGQHFSKGSQFGPEDVDPKVEGSNPTTSKLFSLQEYLRAFLIKSESGLFHSNPIIIAIVLNINRYFRYKSISHRVFPRLTISPAAM